MDRILDQVGILFVSMTCSAIRVWLDSARYDDDFVDIFHCLVKQASASKLRCPKVQLERLAFDNTIETVLQFVREQDGHVEDEFVFVVVDSACLVAYLSRGLKNSGNDGPSAFAVLEFKSDRSVVDQREAIDVIANFSRQLDEEW